MSKNEEKTSTENEKPQQVKLTSVGHIFMKCFKKMSWNSSSNGLPNIVKTQLLCVKIYWIVMFTAAIGGGSYCKYRILTTGTLRFWQCGWALFVKAI